MPIADVYPSAINVGAIIRGVVNIHILVFGPMDLFLKAIAFTVCEHEYMNIPPPPPNSRV
jgi:hypothetical protein